MENGPAGSAASAVRRGRFPCICGEMGTVRFPSIFSAPAVSAKLAVRQSDGLHQVIQAVEAQGGEIQPAADFLHHLPVILAVRVGVIQQHLVGHVIPLRSWMIRRVIRSSSEEEREKFK